MYSLCSVLSFFIYFFSSSIRYFFISLVFLELIRCVLVRYFFSCSVSSFFISLCMYCYPFNYIVFRSLFRYFIHSFFSYSCMSLFIYVCLYFFLYLCVFLEWLISFSRYVFLYVFIS